MKLLALLPVILLIVSCQHPGAVGKQLEGCDSLVINFNTPGTNNIDHSVTTTDTKAINKLVHFADGKTIAAPKCSYDGNLQFYKQGAMIGDVSFNYTTEGCHHFMLNANGTLTPAAMSNEGADFLKSLATGNNWY